jgi:hypothetical protein
MPVGDTVLETSVGRMSDGKWCWRARGAGVVEFCHTYAPLGSPGIAPDGWFYYGPFRSERAAKRDCDHFERAFMEARYPDVEVTDAPDPRSLN